MTTPTIIRTPKDGSSPYVATSRAAAQDERLSFEARGLLWYLLSKPSDWKVVIGDLMKAGHCGRDRVYRLLRELQTAGYLMRERQQQDAKGRLMPATYRVYERPHTENTYTEPHATTEPEPCTEKPYTENRTLQNRDVQKDQETAAAPKNGATAGAQAKPKKPRQRDPIFDAIAECSFSVPVGAEVAKDTAQRVGRVRREVLTIYPDVTEHELRGAYSWHVNAQKLTAPRDPVKVVTMVGVYRAQHRPAAASAIVRDPDCAVCGGTGLILPALGAYEDGDPRANAPVQCPACAKAGRAAEAQREAVGP